MRSSSDHIWISSRNVMNAVKKLIRRLPVKFTNKVFLLMKKFIWTLLLSTIKMIVFGLLATRQTLITVQQDGAPCSHGKAGSKLDCHQLQWLQRKIWTATNSPNHIPRDYHVWGDMLERYKTFQPKPNTIDELKKVLQLIWDYLPQNTINKAINKFWACEKSQGHTLWTCLEIDCFQRILNW